MQTQANCPHLAHHTSPNCLVKRETGREPSSRSYLPSAPLNTADRPTKIESCGLDDADDIMLDVVIQPSAVLTAEMPPSHPVVLRADSRIGNVVTTHPECLFAYLYLLKAATAEVLDEGLGGSYSVSGLEDRENTAAHGEGSGGKHSKDARKKKKSASVNGGKTSSTSDRSASGAARHHVLYYLFEDFQVVYPGTYKLRIVLYYVEDPEVNAHTTCLGSVDTAAFKVQNDQLEAERPTSEERSLLRRLRRLQACGVNQEEEAVEGGRGIMTRVSTRRHFHDHFTNGSRHQEQWASPRGAVS